MADVKELTTKRPVFLDELSEAHYAKLARCIVLTGNIHDIFPIPKDDGTVEFLSLSESLYSLIERAKPPSQKIIQNGSKGGLIPMILRSDGIKFLDPADSKHLRDRAQLLTKSEESSWRVSGGSLLKAMDEMAGGLHGDSVALTALGFFLRYQVEVKKHDPSTRPVALIIDNADALFPNGEMGRLSQLDRETIVRFTDILQNEDIWPDPATAIDRQNLIILLSPTFGQINEKITCMPKVFRVNAGLPDEEVRQAFVTKDSEGLIFEKDYSIELLAHDSAGLTLRALDDLVSSTTRLKLPFNQKFVLQEVQEDIQLQLGEIGKIKFPTHTLSSVRGAAKRKAYIERVKRRQLNPRRAQAGILAVGPNGVGKTFTIEAAFPDYVVIELTQPRSMWFGQTDVLMEKFKHVISAFMRVIITVDEAHKAFGSIQSSQTHETEARLARRVVTMMDDRDKLGRIMWVLITTRPDMLDPDMVRPGRCSIVVPFFDPEGEDLDDFIDWIVQSLASDGVKLTEEEVALLKEKAKGWSAADLEKFRQDFLDERETDPATALANFLVNWRSSSMMIGDERQLQIYLAAERCDRGELMPELYKGKTATDFAILINDLKVRLGHY